MIGCSAEVYVKNEWLHMRCLEIDPTKKHKGEWYCSQESKALCKGKKGKGGKKIKRLENDYKRSYSISAFVHVQACRCKGNGRLRHGGFLEARMNSLFCEQTSKICHSCS